MKQLFTLIILLASTTGLFAVSPSGTLPVMYITTKNNQDVSREKAIDATLYVTGYGKYEALGSAGNQIPLTIKGRGNWTWTGFDKKPYKIVFAQGYGQKLLGMKKSKHWALLAGADDYLGFLKNTTGYILSEQIGLPYTPHQVPVELVINGDYKGLYFVTETIRIDNDRVNIHEQQDGETKPELITGGWLVQIDNYPSEGNIEFDEDNGEHVMITPQSPEDLSAIQRNYITNQMDALNAAIYNRGDMPLQQILDLTDAAKYYLVQEIMEDCESYHGSCYLYKDRDSVDVATSRNVTPKWHFGPVWDFGNAYDRHKETFIYDDPTFAQIWIEQLCQNKTFYQRVKQLWYQYRQTQHSKVLADINAFVSAISSAARRDAERWQRSNVRTNADMAERKQEFLSRMNWRLDWLYSQWGEGDSSPIIDALDQTQPDNALHNANRPQLHITDGTITIEHNGHHYTLTGQPIN